MPVELSTLFDDETVVTFPWMEDATVDMRYVPADQFRRLRERATKKKWHQGQMAEETDYEALNRAVGRVAVAGWSNLNANGKPLEFTESNCDLLMTKCKEFSSFVHENCSSLEKFQELQKEEAEKNCSSTCSTDCSFQG